MKLLSVCIPSYNSQDYLHKAVQSLLPGGDRVEILIVNDGSKDDTAKIADDFERRYPGIVRAVHKENGGHGDAVMCGLAHATGRYFKVVDSDDWVDEDAYPRVLDALAQHDDLDLMICNYIYDKVGAAHKHVVRYTNVLPENRVFTWDDVGRFHPGQYILMHSAIYRTQMLRECGLSLPKHTFYVDNLYVYVPLTHVQRMMYLNLDLYHYFIGRDDQSVQEQVMIRRIDQQLRVNRLMLSDVDLFAVDHPKKRAYMSNYLEIITTISSVMCIKSGTEENLAKKNALWADIRANYPRVYRMLTRRPLGFVLTKNGPLFRRLALIGYRISQKVVGFN